MLSEELAVHAAAGVMLLRSAGELESTYFERMTGIGAGLSGGIAHALGGGVEARAGLEYRRFALTTHAMPGDAFVAGGAVDQTVSFTVGLSYRQ
jgi:hypothetical protein